MEWSLNWGSSAWGDWIWPCPSLTRLLPGESLGSPKPSRGTGPTCWASLHFPQWSGCRCLRSHSRRRGSSHLSGKLTRSWPLPGDWEWGAAVCFSCQWESGPSFCSGESGRCHLSFHLVDCHWVLGRGQSRGHLAKGRERMSLDEAQQHVWYCTKRGTIAVILPGPGHIARPSSNRASACDCRPDRASTGGQCSMLRICRYLCCSCGCCTISLAQDGTAEPVAFFVLLLNRTRRSSLDRLMGSGDMTHCLIYYGLTCKPGSGSRFFLERSYRL